MADLVSARCRLLAVNQFYGHLCVGLEWIPSKHIDTMGVRIIQGRPQCLYNEKFIEQFTVPELCSVIIHELGHLIRLHCVRRGQRDHHLFNIAADMVVNGRAGHCHCVYEDNYEKRKILWSDRNKALTGVFMPDDWPDRETTEWYYDKLRAEVHEIHGIIIDDHGVWNTSETTPEEARQLVASMVQAAADKSPGSVPGGIAAALERFKKPIVRWQKLLRDLLGRHVGKKRLTYSRRPRRREEFGMPGVSHHAAGRVLVIVDTSGSISDELLEQFFAELEAITSQACVSVLQWDADFQGFDPHYRRNDWRRLKICGRGGTRMDQSFLWVMRERLGPDAIVMLTDGYTEFGPVQPIPTIFAITDPEGHSPDWGHVVPLREK